MKRRILGVLATVLFTALTVTACVGLIVALTRPTEIYEGMSILQLLNSKILRSVYVFGAMLFFTLAVMILFSLVLVFKSGGTSGGSLAGGKRENVPGKGRFVMLSEIDAQSKKGLLQESFSPEQELTLAEICENFRNYAAVELGLFYSLEDIRRFIASMGVSKLLIMQGMSGTGKTSLAYAAGKFLQNESVVIPIQPMWKERADMIGYFNEFTGKFNETLLLRKMYEACYSEKMYVTVLDEMNIARVEYYFSEFLSLLELPNEEERYMEVVPDVWKNDPKLFKEGRMLLPGNMWFIGTANNDDSTFAISDKVYDRAMIMNLDKRADPFVPGAWRPMAISAKSFSALLEKAKSTKQLSSEGQKRISDLDTYVSEHLHVTFGNRVMRQTEEYVSVILACGGRENDAIDDMLRKKVFRKLESQNPIFVRSEAQGVLAKIDELFGREELPLCREYLTRFSDLY